MKLRLIKNNNIIELDKLIDDILFEAEVCIDSFKGFDRAGQCLQFVQGYKDTLPKDLKPVQISSLYYWRERQGKTSTKTHLKAV